MKKMLLTLITLFLLVGVLASCGGNGNVTPEATGTEATGEEVTAPATEEETHVDKYDKYKTGEVTTEKEPDVQTLPPMDGDKTPGFGEHNDWEDGTLSNSN